MLANQCGAAGYECAALLRGTGRLGQQRVNRRAKRHGEANRDRQFDGGNSAVVIAIERREQCGELLPLTARESMVLIGIQEPQQRIAVDRRADANLRPCNARIRRRGGRGREFDIFRPRSSVITLAVAETASGAPSSSGPTASTATPACRVPAVPKSTRNVPSVLLASPQRVDVGFSSMPYSPASNPRPCLPIRRIVDRHHQRMIRRERQHRRSIRLATQFLFVDHVVAIGVGLLQSLDSPGDFYRLERLALVLV